MKDNQILTCLHEVQRTAGRRHHRHFSLEGYRLVERALEKGVSWGGAAISKKMAEQPNEREQKILKELEELGCNFVVISDEEMRQRIDGRTFGPILGLVEELEPARLEDFGKGPDKPCNLLVIVEGKDPGNIGALMRTGKASNVDAMVLVGGSDPFQPKAVRTSMGAIFYLPIVQYERSEELLFVLKEGQIQTIGSVVLDGVAPYEGEVKSRRALFVGSEAHGLPMDLQKKLDLLWTIPMHSNVDSFSINAATSVLLYEINRRGWA